MQLEIGSQLGPYRIEGTLGHGGMGHVYRAHDMRLGRSVAIKTAAERFADRFAPEARAISALNHPRICTLYDVGPSYLVMELVDGETLAERLTSGPLPLDEALGIAAQIAEALDAAHGRGIVHRDLKPSNIMLTSNGQVKVLDFGLATLARGGEETLAGGSKEIGTVLGTTGYMAPEQIHGERVDKRADIWAFGIVLYEMLTGARPFESTGNSRLGARTDDERIPRRVRRLLRQCLAPNPSDRLRDIGDYQLLLEEEPAAAEGEHRPSRRAFTGAVVGAAGVAAIGAWGWLRTPATRSTTPVRFAAMLPSRSRVYREAVLGPSLVLSPDGRSLVVAAMGDGGQRLYLRRSDELSATPLSGTTGASSPFFSPDGAWIGFFAEGRLRRVPASGGSAIDIAEAPGAAVGACWRSDDSIVFTCGWRSPLRMVAASGGVTEVVAPLDSLAGEVFMRFPDHLPDGRTVLVGTRRTLEGRVVEAIDLETGKRTVVAEGTMARFVQSGYLLVSRESSLLAAPFDPVALTLSGPLVPLLEPVAYEAGGAQHYAVSSSGALAYVPGDERHALVLLDLAGAERRIVDEQPRFQRPRFAPDGRTLAVAAQRSTERHHDVWIYDLVDAEPPRRLTFDGGTGPVWSQDGIALAFAADPFWTRRQPPGLYAKDADGRGTERRLIELDEFHRVIYWDSESLLFEMTTDDGEFWIERSAGGERRRLVQGINGRLSPDRRWLAYVSDASGRDEIYVMALANTGARWQIAEGADPSWAPHGRELYYISGTRLIGARLDTAAGVRVVSERVVQTSFAPPVYGDYDISPDGRTIALVRSADPAQDREIVITLDWLTGIAH